MGAGGGPGIMKQPDSTCAFAGCYEPTSRLMGPDPDRPIPLCAKHAERYRLNREGYLLHSEGRFAEMWAAQKCERALASFKTEDAE